MEDTKSPLQLMHQKISKGMELTFRKLVTYKAKNDGFLIFSKQGKIVKVQAKDIKL